MDRVENASIHSALHFQVLLADRLISDWRAGSQHGRRVDVGVVVGAAIVFEFGHGRRVDGSAVQQQQQQEELQAVSPVAVLVQARVLDQYVYSAETCHSGQADGKLDNFAAIEAISEDNQNAGCVHMAVSLVVIFDPSYYLVLARAAWFRGR